MTSAEHFKQISCLPTIHLCLLQFYVNILKNFCILTQGKHFNGRLSLLAKICQSEDLKC